MALPPAVGVKLYSSVFPFGMYFLNKKSAIHLSFSYLTERFGFFLFFFHKQNVSINFLFGEV